jgi:hypothetical protein
MGRYISFRIRSRRRALLQEPFGIGAEGLLLVGHTFRFYFLTIRENQSLLAEAMPRADHAVVALGVPRLGFMARNALYEQESGKNEVE